MFFDKNTVAQLYKKFPNFQEADGSLACSQQTLPPTIPESSEYSPNTHT